MDSEDELKTYQPDLVKSPGQVLRETLRELEIETADFIEVSQIDRDYLYRFMAGKAPLSEELAQRLAKWAKLPKWVWWKYENRWQQHLEQKEDQ
jgi:plasmid maintenance system antidote protein VapI